MTTSGGNGGTFGKVEPKKDAVKRGKNADSIVWEKTTLLSFASQRNLPPNHMGEWGSRMGER